MFLTGHIWRRSWQRSSNAGDIAIDDFSLTADTEPSCDGKNFAWRSTGTLFQKIKTSQQREICKGMMEEKKLKKWWSFVKNNTYPCMEFVYY